MMIKGFAQKIVLVIIIAMILLIARIIGSIIETQFGSFAGFIGVVVIFSGVVGVGFTEIPITKKGVLVLLGERTKIVLNEGYYWIPPFITDVMMVNCKRNTRKIIVDEVITPNDQADFKVTVEVTTQPSDLFLYVETDDPDDQLNGVIAETIREFVNDKNTEPCTWEQAEGMNGKFAAIVVAKLMGFEIPRYEEGDSRGEKGHHKKEDHMFPQEHENKKRTLEKLRELRVGEGNLNIPGLGLMIHRFNIPKVEPPKDIKEGMTKRAKEAQEQEAELTETETIAKLVIKFMVTLGYPEKDMQKPEIRRQALEDEKLTTEKLLEMIRVERGKSKENIQRFSIDSSSVIGAMANKILNIKEK